MRAVANLWIVDLRPTFSDEPLFQYTEPFTESATVLVGLDGFGALSAPHDGQHIFVCFAIKTSFKANDFAVSFKDPDHSDPLEVLGSLRE